MLTHGCLPCFHWPCSPGSQQWGLGQATAHQTPLHRKLLSITVGVIKSECEYKSQGKTKQNNKQPRDNRGRKMTSARGLREAISEEVAFEPGVEQIIHTLGQVNSNPHVLWIHMSRCWVQGRKLLQSRGLNRVFQTTFGFESWILRYCNLHGFYNSHVPNLYNGFNSSTFFQSCCED